MLHQGPNPGAVGPAASTRPVPTRDEGVGGRRRWLGKISEVSERRGWAYLLLLPSLLLVAAVVVYPVGSGVLLSFRRMQVNRPRLGTPWIGLDNYTRVLTDSTFWTVTARTVLFTVVSVLLTVVLDDSQTRLVRASRR